MLDVTSEFAADAPGSNIGQILMDMDGHGCAAMPVASCGSDSHCSHEYLGSSQTPSWCFRRLIHTYITICTSI